MIFIKTVHICDLQIETSRLFLFTFPPLTNVVIASFNIIGTVFLLKDKRTVYFHTKMSEFFKN